MTRKTTITVAVSALVVALAIGASVAGAKPGRATAPVSTQAKYTIALSNSFIGNKWRIEMENLFKAACKMPPYKNQVDCSIYNSGNDVSKQTQQISNLISQGVDAIVLNAASPTGLNGIIGQACARGILVVSFDNVVTAPCALKVNTDQLKFGQVLAADLARRMNGKGNVIMVTGVPGTFVDQQRNKGALGVFKKFPGIKVVAKYTGMWDSSTAQRNDRVAAALPPGRRRHLGPGRNRRGAQGVHRRQACPPAADRGRGGERLPQVHAAAGLPGSRRSRVSRSASRPTSSWPRSNSAARCCRASVRRGTSRSRSRP